MLLLVPSTPGFSGLPWECTYEHKSPRWGVPDACSWNSLHRNSKAEALIQPSYQVSNFGHQLPTVPAGRGIGQLILWVNCTIYTPFLTNSAFTLIWVGMSLFNAWNSLTSHSYHTDGPESKLVSKLALSIGLSETYDLLLELVLIQTPTLAGQIPLLGLWNWETKKEPVLK